MARDRRRSSRGSTGRPPEGWAAVGGGAAAAGMGCLEEAAAAATAGEMKELHSVGVVCCWQIFACERVRDYDRAAQWCARVQEFSKRWRLRPLSAICRTQYAGVLIWRGDWAEAEKELTTAKRAFEQVRPPLAVQAFARLGELRLRQGRLDDAERLFTAAGANLFARLGLAALTLERGAAREAAAAIDHLLAQGNAAEPTMRHSILELAVRPPGSAGLGNAHTSDQAQ